MPDAFLDSLVPTTPQDEAGDPHSPRQAVPNKAPLLTNFPYRIALIGEAPGYEETQRGEPFVGMSGRLLDQILSKAGIARDACFVGNVCQYRPPGNDITLFDWNGSEIQSGLAQLEADLREFKPNICVLLGSSALRAAKGGAKIGDWRGSIFISDTPGPFFGKKCLPAYHPAACLRQYDWVPLLMFDLRKAGVEGRTSSWLPPHRDLRVNLTYEELLAELDKVLLHKPLIAIDIEGGIKSFSCISIATSASYCFIVPFTTMSGGNLYDTLEQEYEVWRRLAAILADVRIPKVLQNSLYDRFVLQYSHACIIRGVVDDTMLKHWELYCELEKSLGFQTSIYTDEAFYKSDRKNPDRETFWRYCCRDSAVTYEINDKLDRWLIGPRREHYKFNVELLNPLLYMELRGIPYDAKKAALRLAEVNSHIHRLQAALDKHAGLGLPVGITKEDFLKLAQEKLCYKKDPNRPKAGNEDDYEAIRSFCRSGAAGTPEKLGELSIAAGLSMNIKSPAFKTFLYDTLKLPKQYTTDPKTGFERLCTNYEALLKIQKKQPHPAVEIAIELGELRTRAQMLGIDSDRDHRVRCGYNVVGTETGRLSCYTSPTGSGYNLQTIPSDNPLYPEGHPLHGGMRDLFRADQGCIMFQCDLAGADGWTVAAHLAALGDPTMLDDMRAGIKPAKVLCYLLRHGANSLAGKTREEIYALTAPIKSSSWDYFACKIGQHGTCYLMGPIKLANMILIQSAGKVNFTSNETKDLQRLFSVRYRIKLWHDATSRALQRKPEIVSASGHVRRFFGRYNEILGQALAHEPQANTTYATNLAALRLWKDPQNRAANGKLRVEPLHQVHDALLGQFPAVDLDWALGKIRSWFDNEIVIAHQRIIIPFEGNYGPSWGELKNAI